MCLSSALGDDLIEDMPRVFANGRSILHAGDGLKHTAAAPDVCKTPSPGGPVPVPYVNVASNSDLAKGSTSVHIEGNSVALANSNLSTSMGDEPGTAGGGLVSSKTKGKLTWGSASIDVKFEGKGVVRFMDATQHNGNSFNTAFVSAGAVGGTGFAYGDDFQGLCIICKKDPDSHAVRELKEASLDIANKILKDLKTCEDAWVEADKNVTSAEAELTRLEKDSNVKPETLRVREKNIEVLKRTREGLEKHRRDSGGYMFGVMVCINKEKFAAISGNETPGGFREIAKRHGCEVIEQAATVDDFIAMNPNKERAATDAIRDQWRATMNKSIRPVPEKGYNNIPGTCAGAKLIGKSRHVAHSMTEMYFAFSGADKKASTFNVIYRGPARLAPENGPWASPSAAEIAGEKADTYVEKRVLMRRKKENTVLSCQSCQDTLFMARCDKEKQSCP
jgi:hypothetical protein